MRIRNCVVHDPLRMEWVSDTDARLLADVRFTWDDQDGPQEYVAKAGTRYDGATVPRTFSWLIHRWGGIRLAALIHDCAFKFRFRLTGDSMVSRKYADQLLYCFAVATGYPRPLAYVVRYAVRWFGAGTWNRHDREFR